MYEFYDFTIFSLDHFRTSIWDPPGLLFGGYLALKIAETDLLGPLGPSKSRFQYLLFGSKSLQERSKRLPRSFLAPSASRHRSGPRFGPRFGPQRETLGPEKSRNFVRRPQSFVISPFSARVASGTRFHRHSRAPFWEPFGPQDG